MIRIPKLACTRIHADLTNQANNALLDLYDFEAALRNNLWWFHQLISDQLFGFTILLR